MSRPMPPRALWATSLLLIQAGCIGALPPGPGNAGLPTAGSDPPGVAAGLGTLRQDDVTLALATGSLEIKVTPLDDAVTRLTAPDSQERLSTLARAHRPGLTARAGGREISLFLVSFHGTGAGVDYRPEDLTLTVSGLRERPAVIQPISGGWERQRLDLRETQSAIYAFPAAVDFDQGFVVDYAGVATDDWSRMVPVIQAERGRVRARGGGGGL